MKVWGFVRLLPLARSPVIPLFVSSDDQRFFIQEVDNKGFIAGFSPTRKPADSRIIIKNDPSMPNAKLGERAILAFDRGNQDIAIRRSDKYKAVISDFLQKKFEDISPFACLELSILAGNDKLALQSARECLVQMGGSHSQLAQNWLRGASIPDEIRSTLTETSSNSAFENTDRIWTVNFRGPKVIVRGLTQFCGEVMHRHRSTAIRQIFSPSNRDDLPHSEDMEAIVQAIYELGSSATQEHLFDANE